MNDLNEQNGLKLASTKMAVINRCLSYVYTHMCVFLLVLFVLDNQSRGYNICVR